MPVPTDPYTFVDGPGNTASGVQVNERFKRIYDALNPAVTGLDWSNVQPNGLRESNMATGADGLARGSFRAFRNATLSLATGATIIFDTDSGADAWDVSSWYDPATGIFTPQIAGKYQFSWAVASSVVLAADVFWQARLQKNGADNAPGNMEWQRTVAAPVSVGSMPAMANGTTDAFKVVIVHSVGAAAGIAVGLASTTFAAHLIGRN